jgi:hypothetical protein
MPDAERIELFPPEQMSRAELRKIFRRLFRRLNQIEAASKEAHESAVNCANAMITYAHRVTLAHQRIDEVEQHVPMRPTLPSIPGAE